ncbi:MAG: dTDP-4-amino-4,6-dideoxygalactose transaminase [Planctomycetes bacterium]|nr:dTDP-4-amino-4,6-dideoxygalactose transaminase [Planctomycetota bacterium]
MSIDTASIPFNRPCLGGPEYAYVANAVERMHLSGDGSFTHACHAILEQVSGAAKALLTTSCTHALEMSGLLLELKPGDEVIVPAFTFVSTVNAYVLRGAHPVFADVRADTMNLDERQLESLITPRTKAIVVVHYAGVACEMDAILEIARRHGVPVVEDNAHGLFGSYRSRPLGSFGVMATQSFHETKNIQCGEGGALLLNDPSLVRRAEILREKGTNRAAFFRGAVDKYTWVDVGSSWLPSDMLAAFLLAQLEAREAIQAKRRAVWDRYQASLAGWASDHGVRLPTIPAHCDHPSHMFYMVLPDLAARTHFISHLRAQQIHAVFHYQALHLSPMGRSLGGRDGQCPVTEMASDCLVRLPLWNDLPTADQDRVIEAVRSSM